MVAPSMTSPAMAAEPTTKRFATYRRVLRFQLKQPSAITVVALAGATIALHVFLRPSNWRYEWLRVFDSYHLITLLVGPLFAGVAAWEGIRYAKAKEYLLTGNRQRRAALGSFGAVVFASALSYLAGLAAVVAFALLTGIAGSPDLSDLSTVAPALGLVLLANAVGFTAGWRSQSLYVVPLATIGFFVALLLAFELPGVFVEVGGATGTLIGLAPRTLLQLAQTALYVSVSSLLLGLCFFNTNRERRSFVSFGVTIALVLASGTAIFGLGGQRFEAAPVELECSAGGHTTTGPDGGTALQVCLHPSYEEFREVIDTELQPSLLSMSRTGVLEAPLLLTMDPADQSAGSVYIDPLTFDFDDPYTPVNMMLSTLISPGCDVLATEELSQTYAGLTSWLLAAAGQSTDLQDQSVPEVLRDWQSPEASEWVAQGVALLSTCNG